MTPNFMRALGDAIRAKGWKVENLRVINGYMGVHRFAMDFHCPCGRVLKENMAVSEDMMATLHDPLTVIAYELNREFEKHVEEERLKNEH